MPGSSPVQPPRTFPSGEGLLARLVRAVPDFAAIAVDAGGRIRGWNRGAERLFGYHVGEITGFPLATLCPPERAGDLDALVREARRAGRASGEGSWLRRDGSRFPALEVLILLPDEADGESIGFGLLVHDRSEGAGAPAAPAVPAVPAVPPAPAVPAAAPAGAGEPAHDRVRRVERALRENESRYLQAQKLESLGRLASGIAHDLSNMLTAIMVNAHLILEDLPEGHDLRTYPEEIDQVARHAASLTQQILAYGRSDPPEPQLLDLNDVIAAVAAMLRRLIGENVRLATELDADLARVVADPVQLQQVLLNLAVNARDAMPGGGRITITTRNVREAPDPRGGASGLEPAEPADPADPGETGGPGDLGDSADAGGPGIRGGVEAARGASGAVPLPVRVVLTVTDTGVGMDAAVRKRIFEPFFTTKAPGKGSGLGLATVQTIVGRSGGTIDVESAVGRGTTFRIALPGYRARAVSGSGGGDRQPRRDSGTVLLVDDEEVLRNAGRAALERAGYEVLIARSGNQALWLAAHHDGPIRLVVTDVRMPVMSGPDLARQLRVIRPEIPVLFISGHRRQAHSPGALRSRVAHLSKPFSPADLVLAAQALLEESGEGGGAT